MSRVAPRFLFFLSTPLPLLRRHRHYHRNLFLLSSHSLRLSASPSSFSLSSSPLPLKLRASQFSSAYSSPSPEYSSFVSHISSAGYLSSLPDEAFTAAAQHLSYSFLRDATACLAFARDRPNLLRLLSTRHIAAVVEHGSPFLFRDADDSVRKMKSFLSNGDANVLDTDRANTVDLMKFLLSYASDPYVPSEGNNLNERNLLESSVRNLFDELFKLSYSAPGSNSFDSVQSQMAGRFGYTKPPAQKIEMKRGDWICSRCNFMNFARNIKCLECDEARPKRQLAGGEWECPQCDFYNYGRNMSCLRCDCKRPGQISLGAINTMSNREYENENNFNTSDIDSRLAANEEKAQRWFSKVSQLDSSADINSVIADEDFPEIMPLRKGVNRFVVSPRKTPLERRLANTQYKRNLSGTEDFNAGEPTKPHDSLDDMLGHSAGLLQYGNNNIVSEQNAGGDRQPSFASYSNTSHFKNVQGSYTSTFSPSPLSADEHGPKSENLLSDESKNVVLDPDIGYASLGDSSQLSKNSTNITEDKNKEQAEKSEKWLRKIAELNDFPDVTSAIINEDFPEIMPMRKGENRFVVSKKKDRSLTTPAHKRQVAMEQASKTKFVPFVPFPPDYFAKKDKPQADGTDSMDRSNDGTSSISEVAEKASEISDDTKAQPEQSPKSSEQSSDNNDIGSMSWSGASGNSRQSFNQDYVPNLTGSSSPVTASDNQSGKAEWTGKSLEGFAVKEPDPLDMSEEAKAERWFRRVAQIKDISELSQIPDEDFPSIMPMRKGVNRFVVSKRKTPLERRLTSQQYRRNLPTVSSDPSKNENEGS
ncbi:zinc finger protein VAR3, chloroplastic-like [Vigna radiata var. radiata]|uniref:Zinc finger protein VAR3, chloroplastic-like n=1 Tax=Vigna radiata var. radiata TaxID=3916 RepID=A0A1S3UFK0_VIGRR|nr:zinc finger protein VAR3, chloroplastic-like [Vigna radiata var. radiata]